MSPHIAQIPAYQSHMGGKFNIFKPHTHTGGVEWWPTEAAARVGCLGISTAASRHKSRPNGRCHLPEPGPNQRRPVAAPSADQDKY